MIDLIYQTFRIDNGHSGEWKGEYDSRTYSFCVGETVLSESATIPVLTAWLLYLH